MDEALGRGSIIGSGVLQSTIDQRDSDSPIALSQRVNRCHEVIPSALAYHNDPDASEIQAVRHKHAVLIPLT